MSAGSLSCAGKPGLPGNALIRVLWLVAFGSAIAFAGTDTLDAVSGEGAANDFSATGASVGDDCAAIGGTATSATQNNNLSVPIANSAKTDPVISKIKVRAYAYSNGNGQFETSVFSGTDRDGATKHNLTGSYSYYDDTWVNNPFTTSAWTWDDINALEAGGRTDKTTGNPNIYVDQVEVVVFYTAEPVITGRSAAANLDSDISQRTDGSGILDLYYEVSDADGGTVDISMEYWNGSTWSSPAWANLAGDTGAVSATSSSTDRQIIWDADGDLGAVEVTGYNLQIIADDGTNQDTVKRSANDQAIDTRAPTGYGCLTPTHGTDWPGPRPTLRSSLGSDQNTISYRFEIDTSGNAFSGGHYQGSGWQSAANTWTPDADLNVGDYYWWRVDAKDLFGNEGGFANDTFDFQVSPWRPNLVIDSAKQTSTDGTGMVTLYYDLTDPTTDICTLAVQYSFDNSTWKMAHIGNVSTGDTNNAGVDDSTTRGQIHNLATDIADETFAWDSKSANNQGGAFTGEDATVWLKGIPRDENEYDGELVVSLSFELDNRAPQSVVQHYPADAASGLPVTAILRCTQGTDQNDREYYFEIADNAGFTGSENSGWQGDTTWDPSIVGGTTYYWRVRARDNPCGNTGSFGAAYSFGTLSGWSYGPVGGCTAPAVNIDSARVYVGSDDGYVYAINTVDGTPDWSYQAKTSAVDIGNVTVVYLSNRPAIYFTDADAKLHAIWDNGSGATAKFSSVDLGNQTMSDPMPDPYGDSVYIMYQNRGYKRSGVNGGAIWETGNIAPDLARAPIVDNASVYFPRGGGIQRFLLDGTSHSTASYGSEGHIGIWSGTLYIPNGNYVYAVDAGMVSSGKTGYTAANLGGATTGIIMADGGVFYTSAGAVVKQVNAATGSETDTYTLPGGASTAYMPVVSEDGTRVFLGSDLNKAYALDSNLDPVSGWPKDIGVGEYIPNQPAVDGDKQVVIFTSDDGGGTGNVYGYAY
ncbi:MAG: PQQ-binding-like beta-propeller repeat protein [Chitinivibrionales bacterium]|nr:PQQ-binding-like beta-propeller repeat protein [Chitinivibrionales bacterium]MBD3396216.1 PQQ-binding-like beta-propeller repeat protein [Chitinivibrionales bacterium]